MARALIQLTRLETAQHTQWAPLPVQLQLKPTFEGGTDKQVMMTRKNAMLFPAVVPWLVDKGRNNDNIPVNSEKPLSYRTTDTGMVFMTKLAFEKGDTYEGSFKQPMLQ